jgi:hypothetical protein
MTAVGIWLKLDPKVYRRIHNVILPARNGTTQIDHVVVSIYGLFVIETKNMDGWIFGTAQQETWTQQFFSKKFKFQNPLRQNYRHTRCLAEFLNLDHDLLHSVVFFIGDVELKTSLPDNVLIKGLSNYIRRFTTPSGGGNAESVRASRVLKSTIRVRHYVSKMRRGVHKASRQKRRNDRKRVLWVCQLPQVSLYEEA